MTARAVRIRGAGAVLLPGIVALAVVAGVMGSAIFGLISAAGGDLPSLPWGYVGDIVRFTLMQATLSTVLSLALGAALALALARRSRFPGRRVLLAVMNLAVVLPPVVVVFGVVAVFGRAGWLGTILGALGWQPGSWLYGLPGILIGHVFFNAPLAARVFLAAIEAVPAEHWRLASHLGMSPSAMFRLIDRPVLMREAPSLAALIFLLCFTSFALVLALGGGPGAATLEVAIYEALRFDADFPRAAALAGVQIAVCLALVAPVFRMERRLPEIATSGWREPRGDAASRGLMCLDAAVLVLGGGLVVLPIAAVVVSGIPALGTLAAPSTLSALATSFAIALPAGLLSVALALGLATLARRLRLSAGRGRLAALVDSAGIAILLMPPFTLAAGLFVVARTFADPFALGIPMIVLVNALMALPFAMRLIEPPLTVAAERYGRLAESLGISGWNRLRLVDGPLVARPMAMAFATAVVLSLGDLGVAAFFGAGGIVTLPLLIYQRLGAYRMDEAASVALMLAAVAFLLFLAALLTTETRNARD